MSGFEDFAEAAARGSRASQAPGKIVIDRVAVLGGGDDACLIAALCLSEGAEVTLFSAYGAELAALRASSGIGLRDAGPVGTYQVDRDGVPAIRTTAELDSAVAGAQAIFLTGPVHKQRTYAMVLASHLRDGQILVLAPGRSLGALEAAWFLRIGGSTADITLVEAQGLPYWIDASGSQLSLSEAGPVAAATLPSGRAAQLAAVSRFLPNLAPCDSVLASGFADGSALVELPALLLAGPAMPGGAVDIPMGGQPLPGNQTFAALIGDAHRAVIARLADERRAVARGYGLRDLPDDATWIAAHAGALRGAGARRVPGRDVARQIIRDGVIGSLVPLVSAARLLGRDLPATTAMIELAATVLGADVAAAGRRLDTIGITADDIETARRAMDRVATGGR